MPASRSTAPPAPTSTRSLTCVDPHPNGHEPRRTSSCEALGGADAPEAASGSLAQAQRLLHVPRPALVPPRTAPSRVPFSRDALREAIDLVRQMDPIGVGARDLRECLLAQLNHLKTIDRKNGNGNHACRKRIASTTPS